MFSSVLLQYAQKCTQVRVDPPVFGFASTLTGVATCVLSLGLLLTVVYGLHTLSAAVFPMPASMDLGWVHQLRVMSVMHLLSLITHHR